MRSHTVRSPLAWHAHGTYEKHLDDTEEMQTLSHNFATDHSYPSSSYYPIPPAGWGPTTPTPTLTSASTIAHWAAEELPRQHEILMRENGEFWEEIEQLREENEQLRARAETSVTVAL